MQLKIILKSKLILSAIFAIILSFITYASLVVILNDTQPILVVVSNAMFHDSSTEQTHYAWLKDNLGYDRQEINSWPISNGFGIGDLILTKRTDCSDVRVGDVIVYSVEPFANSIAHRVIKVNPDGTFQTKGDHNSDLLPLEISVRCEKLLGKVAYVIPKLGHPMRLIPLPICVWFFIPFFAIIYVVLSFKKYK